LTVVRSKVLGFCMGVRRAVALAETEADRMNLSGQVFSLGPLVHNPFVLSALKNRGIDIFDETVQNLKNCSLIIRAHGIDPFLEDDFRSRGAVIVDATCPKVKESQLKVKALAKDGFSLFLAGDASHAEIAGLKGYAGNALFAVVSDIEKAESAAQELTRKNKNAKPALLGQTTFSGDDYQKIGEMIKKYFPCLKIFNTICSATFDRQQALRDLLDNTEAVIIAGGRESANTRRLFEIAQGSDLPCILIEKAEEILESFFKYKRVGICSGASTPDTVIDEIEKELKRKSE